MNQKPSLRKNNARQQKGNIFFMLFAAVALVGAFGIGATTVMRGLVTSMSDVTRKAIAEERMTTAARLSFQHPAQFDPAADCDSATENTPGQIFLEPMVTRNAGALPHPANGGLIPENIGANTKDPWGTQYGYCAWDPGPSQCATSISPRRLAGTADPADTVVAIISAGKDRVFQTICNNGAAPAVTKSSGGDDIVMEFSYNDVQGLGGDDLWKIKDISPDTATIEKNIEVTGGADFTGAINLMQQGLILPTETDAGHTGSTCLTAQQGEMRINTATSPISLEICNNNTWIAMSMGASNAGPADCTGLGDLYYNDAATGHCYYRTASSVSWSDADSYCSAEGDYLSVISSSYENSLIFNNACTSATGCWIGANEIDVTGEWRWKGGELDGTQFWSGEGPGSSVGGLYSNWQSGDPSNGSAQQCLRIGFYSDGTWDDFMCSAVRKGVCERTGSRAAGGAWIPPEGLIGWWRFDETGGTAAEDGSVNDNMGTLTNGASFDAGIAENAVLLDGTNDYVGMGSPASLDENIRTACAWIYPDGLSSSATGTIIGKTNGSTIGPRLYVTGNGNVGGSVDGALQQSNGILSQGAWHQLCMTWTGTGYAAADIKIYLDGTDVTDGDVTSAGAAQSDAALDLRIGTAGGADFFKGKIDEAMVFDRTLTENEILSIYQNTADNIQTGDSCDFSNITSVSMLATGADWQTMRVQNDYLWNTNETQDRIYYNSLSDPSAPGASAYIEDHVNLNEINSITGYGNYIYVMSKNDGRLTVVDISSPSAPVVRGSVTHASLANGAQIQALDQNHIVVLSNTSHRLTIVSVSNPASPVVLSTLTDSSLGYPDGLDIAGNYIYVAATGSDALTIVDATDRNNPVVVGHSNNPALAYVNKVRVNGRYAYTTSRVSNKVIVTDISNPAAPVVVGEGSDQRMDDALWIESVGNYVITSSNDAILVWSLLNPANPMVVGSYGDAVNNASFDTSGRYLYTLRYSQINVLDLGCDPGGNGDDDDAVSTSVEPDPAVIIATNQFSGQFSSGDSHSCLIKKDGSAWCGGSDDLGQLGIGVDDSHQETLNRVLFTATPWPAFTQITSSLSNTCALDSGGLAWCWGEAALGKLGNGTTTPQANNPVQVSGGHRFTQINAGGDAICGIRYDGRILCWGDDSRGILGNGASGSSSTPFLMPDTGPWIKVHVGNRHACGIKSDGTAWCWGRGSDGQVGNGTTTLNIQSPQLVAESGPWIDIVAGPTHSCGLKIDGTAWCWGSNLNGNIGIGSLAGTYPYPQKVSDSGPWLQLAVNRQTGTASGTTCGLKMDGTAWCWGNNEDGQFGDGTTANSGTPTRVNDPGPWALLSVGNGFVCGMKTNGSAWCWGDDDPVYQLSNGAGTGDTHVPTPVLIASNPSPSYFEANLSLQGGSAISYDGSSISGVSNGLRFDTAGQTVLRHASAASGLSSPIPPITNGLIGYWSFNDITGSTTAVDSIGGNTATLQGNATLREGKYGNALYLDGVGDSANLGSIASLNNVIMSSCAWIYQESLLQPYGSILYKSNYIDAGFEFYTFDNGAKQGGFAGSKNATAVETQYDAMKDYQWNHVCASWSGEGLNPSTISLYLNGALYTQTPGSTSSGTINGDDSSANLLIGYNFRGYIDDVMIFNRPLTAEDVTAIYSTPYYTGSIDLKLDAQGSTASSQLSWKAASAGTTRTLGIDYLTRSLELGNNNAAVTNWMHAISPVMEITETGNVGIGTTGTANARLDISNGGLRIGGDSGICAPIRAGTLRYVGGTTPYEYCDGANWQAF